METFECCCADAVMFTLGRLNLRSPPFSLTFSGTPATCERDGCERLSYVYVMGKRRASAGRRGLFCFVSSPNGQTHVDNRHDPLWKTGITRPFQQSIDLAGNLGAGA